MDTQLPTEFINSIYEIIGKLIYSEIPGNEKIILSNELINAILFTGTDTHSQNDAITRFYRIVDENEAFTYYDENPERTHMRCIDLRALLCDALNNTNN
jgi:hypothetical protein